MTVDKIPLDNLGCLKEANAMGMNLDNCDFQNSFPYN